MPFANLVVPARVLADLLRNRTARVRRSSSSSPARAVPATTSQFGLARRDQATASPASGATGASSSTVEGCSG
ncbi:hypothetical protein [Micromonospora chalcea]